MKESELEARLVRGIKALGGVAYKFVSPGSVGVPDRLVVLPGGITAFVELKTEDGRLSRAQAWQIHRLQELGADVAVVRGAEGVARYLECCRAVMGGEL